MRESAAELSSINFLTTSCSSALSKKLPAYYRIFSGLSSSTLNMKSCTMQASSGCYRKYFSFSMRSSSFFFSISFFCARMMPSTPIKSWLL